MKGVEVEIMEGWVKLLRGSKPYISMEQEWAHGQVAVYANGRRRSLVQATLLVHTGLELPL